MSEDKDITVIGNSDGLMKQQQDVALKKEQIGKFQYENIKRVTIHASSPGKMNDTIRIELLQGNRVITVRGEWGSAEVTDSSEEAH